VAHAPGATQLTRMPSGPNSSARALVSPSSAVLLTAYMAMGGAGLKAVYEEMYTMLLPGFMCRTTSWVSSTADLTARGRVAGRRSGAGRDGQRADFREAGGRRVHVKALGMLSKQ
jgi:hypothetical protein